MSLIANINTIYKHITGGALRIIGGWTGLEQCGNLFDFTLDVKVNPFFANRYGYLDPGDADAHGSLSNNTMAETIVYAAYSESNFGYSIFRFGATGVDQIQNLNEIVINWQGIGKFTYVWDGANLNYRYTGQDLADYVKALNTQRTSFINDYIAVQATVDGSTALRRVVASSAEANEITVSMWVWRDSGVNVPQKLLDVGDSTTSGTETNRLRFSGAAVLGSFLSNTPDGGTTWSSVAKITASGGSTEDRMNHLYMTAKNDLVDGVGTQIMELWENGLLVGTDTTFLPSNSATFSFVAGDFVTLLARHDLTQFLTGRVAEVWSSGKFLPGASNIQMFRQSSPANISWAGGVPVDLGASGVVNGVAPGNYLGGPDYTIADWNNGVNRGSASDFDIIGNPIT